MTTRRALATPLHAPFTHPAARARATPPPIARRAPLATLALLSLAPAIAGAIAMVLAASLIGPFMMFAIPLMLAFGCALGPLHALARGEL